MPYSIKIIRELEQLDPKLRKLIIAILEEIEKNIKETVKKSDFDELKQIVAQLGQKITELSEAQKITEQRISELTNVQKEAIEAQTRLENTVHELAEAQKASEKRLTKLEQTVQELAEAQKSSEERLTKLEITVQELAEAQKKTEEELKKLIIEHKESRKILGGISDVVGYGLEDKIFPYIERFAKGEFNIIPKEIGRKNIIYPNGKFDELNIYVDGEKEGNRVYLVGECKTQLGKKDITRFDGLIKRVSSHLNRKVYAFIVSHSIQPTVEEYLNKFYPDIRFYYSYYFELKYKN